MAARKVCYRRSFRYFSFLLPLLVFSLYFYAFASAVERYVYPQQQSLEGGLRLNFAGAGIQYPHIQAAIDDACDGDIIYLAKGRFSGSGNRDLDFKGKAITVSSLDPNNSDTVAATIIDCNGSETDKHRGFYFHSGEDNNSVICGITVTNGWHDYGGGIYCEQSSPYISHCNITTNSAGIEGSAICFENSFSILADCIITDNKISDAIDSRYSSNLLVQNCIVKNNYKGGIFSEDGSIEIINCRIEKNTTGGVISYGAIKISNCQIIGNGDGSSWTSGGVFLRSNGVIESSAIIGNSGFGIYGWGDVNNCIISYNHGYGTIGGSVRNSKITNNEGDGISLADYSSAVNCVVAENRGRGIIYGYKYRPWIINCTVVNNGGEGIIAPGSSSPSHLNMANCIIRGNDKGQLVNISTGEAPWNIITHSNIEGGWKGAGNIDSDPCFVSELDWHLMPTSPCIDAGTNDPNYVTEPNDIEGSPRILDGDGDGIAVADMGAYEYNSQQPVIAAWAKRILWFRNTDQQSQNKIYIKNAGTGILNYEIESDCNWFAIVPSQGVSAGQIQEVNVVVDINKIELGDYLCRIRIYDQNAPNSPLDCWLAVHIGNLWIVPTDFNTIQEAIDEANDYDHICVLDGTYTGAGNTDVSFSGKDVVLYSAGGAENCIIDCQQTTHGFMFVSGETSEAVLDGFSIINAGTEAVYCDAGGSPIITNCTISNSRYSGVYIGDYCWPVITNCKFNNCSSGVDCPPVYDCGVSIYNCEFSNNIMTAVHVWGCQSVVLKDCNITSSGTGVTCDMMGRMARKVSIENCVIQDRESGIFLREVEQGKISNCILTGNGNIWWGWGSMDIWFANIVVQNCLLTGNSIGCTVLGGLVSFENCTFTGNYAYASEGSTLWCYGNSEVNFVNCILWDEGNSIRGGEGSIDISYSDVRGGWEGVGNINEDPCFIEPGYRNDNNTPDDPYDDFWVDGDYHLQSFGWRWDADRQDWVFDRRTSRCIDAGSPGYPLGDEPLTVPPDPHNLWGENLRIDMGYYGGTAEASMPPYGWALLSDMDNSGDVDFADYSYLAQFYGSSGEKLNGDLNHDGKIDFADISLIADDWLDYTDWAVGR